MTVATDSRATEVPLRATVLGSVLVQGRGRTMVEPPGALAKNLIVALVLARGAVSVRGLVDDLWDAEPPRHEKAALQTLVSRVRATSADDLLVSTSGGYALAATPEQTDLGLARELLTLARARSAASEHVEAEALAGRGLALWSGEPGSDLGDSVLAAQLAETAQGVRCELLRVRAAARIELGDGAGGLADVDAMLLSAPLDEDLRLLQLRALAASGRRNEAVRAFAEFRSQLRDELGTSPSAALVEFNAGLLRDDAPSAAHGVRIGLRVPPNKLLGRDDDIVRIERLMRQSRLTTIVGAGGLGKTRLAQELAARATERTPAVVVVELASVRSGDDITLALATTLGIREASARLGRNEPGARLDIRERILVALAEQQTLLVVDNCEHLVEDAARWVSDILESTSSVRVLATSRSPLAIAAERIYPLEPLPAKGAEGDETGPAVELFLDRARAARPAAVLPIDVVARLCDRLDGLPLAIELAAAKVRSMSVEEVERRLSNRFALLKGGDPTAPERHRTLLAVIDWSWNLLGDTERAMLRRLSRFPDGFSEEAARFVASSDPDFDATDDLDALVSQSLVTVTENPDTGVLRYRMLETVREFCDVALVDAGEDPFVRDRMFDWAVDFSVKAALDLVTVTQVQAFKRLTLEQDNLVAILRAALTDDRKDVVVQIFAVLAYQWSLQGAHSEVVGFAAPVITAIKHYEPADDEVDAMVSSLSIAGATSLFANLRLGAVALSALRRLKKSGRTMTPWLAAMSDLLLCVTRPERMVELIAEYTRSSDPQIETFGHLIDAQLKENAGELEAAKRAARRAYELAEQRGDISVQGMSAQALTQLYSETASPEKALEWAEKAFVALRMLGNHGDFQQVEWMIAANEIALGRPENALATFERFASGNEDELGFDFVDLRAIGYSGLAEIALAAGDTEEGLRRYRRAVEFFDVPSQRLAPWLFMVSSGAIAAAVASGEADDAYTRTLVRASRVKLIVMTRMRPEFVDKPVLGAAILGPAVWFMEPGRSPSEDEADAGIELFALSRALGSRQDIGALRTGPHLERAIAAYGRERVDAAFAAADALTMDQRSDRALEILRGLRP